MKLVSAVVLLTAGLAVAGCAATSGYKERRDLVSDPSACADKRFEVYFVPDRATLTDAARQAMKHPTRSAA